jgi:hypothetical protein
VIDALTISRMNVDLRLTDAVRAGERLVELVDVPVRYESILTDYYRQLQSAKEKGDVAAITQTYLDKLMKYVKEHPKSPDAVDAMLQIVLVYTSQGKTVEAEAWQAKLLKEHPDSPAAKRVKDAQILEMRKAAYRLLQLKFQKKGGDPDKD